MLRTLWLILMFGGFCTSASDLHCGVCFEVVKHVESKLASTADVNLQVGFRVDSKRFVSARRSEANLIDVFESLPRDLSSMHVITDDLNIQRLVPSDWPQAKRDKRVRDAVPAFIDEHFDLLIDLFRQESSDIMSELCVHKTQSCQTLPHTLQRPHTSETTQSPASTETSTEQAEDKVEPTVVSPKADL